jgi:predicted dehydrogenase
MASPSVTEPMRVLVVSARLTDPRRRALAALVTGAVDITGTDVLPISSDLPPPDRYDAVVVDGGTDGLTPEWLTALHRRVESGASLLRIGGDGRAGDDGPRGEWFAKVVSPTSVLTQRAPEEFPVVDRLQPLSLAPTAHVCLSVSVGFTDRPALAETALGRGRVVSSGLGNTEEALGNKELATVLRRALRRSGAPDRGGRPIGLAVAGYGPYGGMGYHHGAAAQATTGLELVAACDESAERRKAAEAEFPGVRTYPTVSELARDDDVEVVVVATPPVSHTSITLALLRAGKHVACEKPLCFTVADADEMLATARAYDLSLTVNQSRRWDADFVAIRRAVRAGLLGELFNVETFVGGFEHPCRAWHSEASVSGGTVFDWGSHHLDWMLLLMEDMPAVVEAHGHKRVWHDVTNLDQLRVRLRWSDGREAEFVDSSVAAIRRPKFYLQGTAGTLAGWYRPLTFERLEPGVGYMAQRAHHAEAPAELTLARYESGAGLSETRLPPAAPQPFAFHRNLADHLALGERLTITADSIRQVVVLLEAAHRSVERAGAPVEVAPG